MKVRKAIIPAAGLGTRVLPASKALPKEMLPIVDKPVIQYLVEECVQAGITDILIITSRGKGIIEDHFDHSFELEAHLEKRGQTELLTKMQDIAQLANIQFIRQKKMLGLGHAVLTAKSFVGNEPFAVLYGDDVVIGENSATGELIEAYEKYGLGVCGIKPVPAADISKYSSLKVEPLCERTYKVTDMIEKPAKGEEFSLYSILGRCVLPPEIFTILEQTKPGAGNEIQLTDAMKQLAYEKGMTGYEYTGTRYDMGNKFGIVQAACEVALKHPEISDQFAKYIKELAAKI